MTGHITSCSHAHKVTHSSPWSHHIMSLQSSVCEQCTPAWMHGRELQLLCCVCVCVCVCACVWYMYECTWGSEQASVCVSDSEHHCYPNTHRQKDKLYKRHVCKQIWEHKTIVSKQCPDLHSQCPSKRNKRPHPFTNSFTLGDVHYTCGHLQILAKNLVCILIYLLMPMQ